MDATAQTGEQKSLRENALREIENVKWHPNWGEGSNANMFKGRPDWCVSRQRSWGVPIPVFYCAGCDEAVADPEIVNHVADIFSEETADAWYNREAKDLLPENFQMSEMRRRGIYTRKPIFSTFGSIPVRRASRFWKRATICGFRRTFISKAAINFAAGLIRA